MLNLAGRTRSLAQSSSRHVASRRAAQRGSAEAERAAEREPTAYLLELFGLPQAGVRALSARGAARTQSRKLATSPRGKQSSQCARTMFEEGFLGSSHGATSCRARTGAASCRRNLRSRFISQAGGARRAATRRAPPTKAAYQRLLAPESAVNTDRRDAHRVRAREVLGRCVCAARQCRSLCNQTHLDADNDRWGCDRSSPFLP